MRRALLLVGLVACESGNPWPEKAPSVEGMTQAQACDAVRKRVYPCIDDMVLADMMALMDVSYDEAKELMGDQPRNTAKAVVELTRATCFGNRGFAASVARCWDAKSCKELAICVSTKSERQQLRPLYE